MPLFQPRQRDAARAASPRRLTETIPPEARAQLAHALTQHVLPDVAFDDNWGTTDWDVLNNAVRAVIVPEWGKPSLTHSDTRNLLLNATDHEVLDGSTDSNGTQGWDRIDSTTAGAADSTKWSRLQGSCG